LWNIVAVFNALVLLPVDVDQPPIKSPKQVFIYWF
jgi:hypothetical protein